MPTVRVAPAAALVTYITTSPRRSRLRRPGALEPAAGLDHGGDGAAERPRDLAVGALRVALHLEFDPSRRPQLGAIRETKVGARALERGLRGQLSPAGQAV